MCKYCDLIPSMDGTMYYGRDLPMDDNGYMCIFKDEESNFGLRYEDYENDEHDLFIKYCPMCGRNLST